MQKIFSNEEKFAFQQQRILGQLLDLVNDPQARSQVLSILTFVTIKTEDKKIPLLISRNIVAKLITSGSAATIHPESLEMRRDLLSTLSNIYTSCHTLKSTFRMGGGFVWALSVLSNIGRKKDNQQSPSKEKESQRYVFEFLIALIDALGEVIKGDKENQEYFESQIQFATLADSILNSGFFEGNNSLDLCNAILTIAVELHWPPVCVVHGRNGAGERRRTIGAILSIEELKKRICCSKCLDGLKILFPEVIESLIKLLKQSWNQLNEKQKCHILDQVELLLRASPNYGCVQSKGRHLVLVLFEQFGEILKGQTEKNVQRSVMKIVEVAGSFSLSSEEARQFFKLMAPGEKYPINLLQTMLKIATTSYCPSHYMLFPSNTPSFIKVDNVSGSEYWPPNKAWSLSFWFQLSKSRMGPMRDFIDQKDNTLNLVSIFDGDFSRNPKKLKESSMFITVSLVEENALQISSTRSHFVVFNSVKFKEGTWYQLSISHQRMVPNKESTVKVYVNGVFKASKNLPYPVASHSFASMLEKESSPTPLPSYFEKLIARKKSSEQIPESGPLSFFQYENPKKTCLLIGSLAEQNTTWKMGNLCLFEDMVLQDEEATLSFVLGPSHAGFFNAKLSSFAIPEIINNETLEQYKEDWSVLTKPGEKSLRRLQKHLQLLFNPLKSVLLTRNKDLQNKLYLGIGNVLLGQQPSPGQQYVLAPRNFESSGVLETKQIVLKETIYNVGGVPIIIYLLGTSKSEQADHVLYLFKILQATLRYSPKNLNQMNFCKGYLVVAGLLKVTKWIHSEELMETLFHITGLSVKTLTVLSPKKRDSMPGNLKQKYQQEHTTFSRGCIRNLTAFEHWLFNWSVWCNAPAKLQKTLFDSFAELVTIHTHSEYHIECFNKLGGIQAFLDLFVHQNPPPYACVPSILQCIKVLMKPSDIEKLYNFLVITLPQDNSTKQCFAHSKSGTPVRRMSFSLISSDSKNSLPVNLLSSSTMRQEVLSLLLSDFLSPLSSSSLYLLK